VNTATGVASGMNRVMLGHRPEGTAREGGGSEVELEDAEEEEEAEDLTMTESATMAATATGTETVTGVLATNE